jgi:hypothetical protein
MGFQSIFAWKALPEAAFGKKTVAVIEVVRVRLKTALSSRKTDHSTTVTTSRRGQNLVFNLRCTRENGAGKA